MRFYSFFTFILAAGLMVTGCKQAGGEQSESAAGDTTNVQASEENYNPSPVPADIAQQVALISSSLDRQLAMLEEQLYIKEVELSKEPNSKELTEAVNTMHDMKKRINDLKAKIQGATAENWAEMDAEIQKTGVEVKTYLKGLIGQGGSLQ